MKIFSYLNKSGFFFPTGVILLVVLTALQFIRPEIKDLPASGEIQAPPDVKALLKKACYDCHSNETKLGWADKISPIYWQVAKHVNTGRSHLNFSDWKRLSSADQNVKLWEAVNQAALGAMPVHDYAFVHPSANLSGTDLRILKNYLATMIDHKASDTAKINAETEQFTLWRHDSPSDMNLPVALNGVAYDPEYKNWQLLSTTERFDTKTMRVIFGNPIAVKAVKEKNIHPWPDGTRFAKAAWTQIEDKNGNVRTGTFLQVGFMIKDARKYASSGGWGFATFLTPKMIPYGKTAMFANECIACHRPVENADYVFTLPIKQ
jgi:hypothetical protein